MAAVSMKAPSPSSISAVQSRTGHSAASVGETAGHGNHLRACGNRREQAFLNVDNAEQGGGGMETHQHLAVWEPQSIPRLPDAGSHPGSVAQEVWKEPPVAVEVLMLVPLPEIVLPVTVELVRVP
jgi:hypothetical protein